MGNDGHGHALLGKVTHQIQHLTHHFRVKGGGRLVKQHDLRVHGQCTDNGNTLLLAAGKHVGVLIGLIGKADTFQQRHGLLLGLLGCFLLQGNGRHGDVLQHRLMGKQVEVLEHHAHLLAVQVDIHRLTGQIHAIKEDLAGGGLLQQIQAAQQRGLAGAGGTDDGHYLSLFDLQIAVIQRMNGTVIVLLHQMLHGNENIIACRHDASSFRWPRWLWRPGS